MIFEVSVRRHRARWAGNWPGRQGSFWTEFSPRFRKSRSRGAILNSESPTAANMLWKASQPCDGGSQSSSRAAFGARRRGARVMRAAQARTAAPSASATSRCGMPAPDAATGIGVLRVALSNLTTRPLPSIELESPLRPRSPAMLSRAHACYRHRVRAGVKLRRVDAEQRAPLPISS